VETPEETDLDLGGTPEEDPFDGVEPGLPDGVEPGTLGGENPSDPESLPDDPDPLADPAPEPTPESEPEPETPVEETAPPEEGGVPDDSVGTEPESLPEEETPPATPPKPKATGGSSGRPYVILKSGSGKGAWAEAFDREDKDKPFQINARNTEAALRKAYRMLTENEEEPQSYTLVPIPASHFKPTPVRGRQMKQTAISVG
jgi:hypothetical protein